MKQFKGILLAMISSATFGMIPLFALPVIRGGMGVDSVMFYRFALSSAVVGAYLLLRRMIGATPAMHFNMIESDGELCGLFVYWDMGEFYYLEHLAVAPHMRNRKIGQQVLEHVETSLPGIRLLEVEPAEDELTARRVAFYRRNGYRIVDRSYVQPSYENFGDAAPLWIMGNDTPERLPEFIERIKKEVYRDPLAR